MNKAIGWALRDYAKTDQKYVKSFIDRHGDEMAGLSIKEARKYL